MHMSTAHRGGTFAFPLQQRLHENATMLSYLYTASLLCDIPSGRQDGTKHGQ
jgi:hypothetical protein